MNKLTKLTAGAALIGALAIGTVACSMMTTVNQLNLLKLKSQRRALKRLLSKMKPNLRELKLTLVKKML